MGSNKKKKSGNGKVAVIIISVLLALTVLGVVIGLLLFKVTENMFRNSGDEDTSFVEGGETVEMALYQDFWNRKLTADEYVKYSLYSVYDTAYLDEEYQGIGHGTSTVDASKMVKQYYDELSEETLEYYYEKVMLKGITFEPDKENEEVNKGEGLDDLFTMKAYADEKLITNLDEIVASPNEKIIVWYTTTGASACDEETAQKVANGLEKTIERYEELFGYDYVFEGTIFTDGENYDNQVQILKDKGYSEDCLKDTMQVYIANYSDAKASYVVVPGCVREFFMDMFGSDSFGGVVAPYIIIGTDALKDYEGLEQLYNHELFHHFQEEVFTDGEMETGGEFDLISEGTANWASSLVSYKTTPIGFLNENSAVVMRHGKELLDEHFLDKNSWGNVGYAFFVYLYYYSEVVQGGTQQIIDAMYAEEPLEYLSNININDAYEIQKHIVLNAISRTNKNVNLIPDPTVTKQYFPIIEVEIDLEGLDNFKIRETNLSPIGFEFYELDNRSKDYGYNITFTKVEGDSCVYVIGSIDGEYVILESFEQDDEIVWNADVSIYTEVKQMYIAVANPSFWEKSEHIIIVSKVEYSDEEEEIIEPEFSFDDETGEGEEDSELDVEVDDAGAVGHMSFVKNDPMYEGYQKYITTLYYNEEGEICRHVVTHYWETEELAQKWYEINEEEGYLHNHLDGKVITVEYAYDVVAVQFEGYTVDDLQEWKDNPGTSFGWIVYGEYIDFTPVF